jgi:sterol desaturase/sphingolipid hydroxylase (fatty acid hydroxylase superfamily)
MFGYAWATYCAEHKWGLLNHLTLPGWINGLVTFLVLDLLVYSRHWVAHHTSLFWRLHRLHHTDNDIDFTTTLRFHPVEALLVTALEGGMIALLGASPIGVVCFRLIGTFTDFTSHANLKIPARFDLFVRRFVITPDMHRTHHSQRFEESNSNYGNILPIWDRCLGTYLAEPADGQSRLQTGVIEFSERKHQLLPWMLAQPFLSQPRAVPAEDPAIAFSRDMKRA